MSPSCSNEAVAAAGDSSPMASTSTARSAVADTAGQSSIALGPGGVLVAVDRDPESEAVARTWRDARFRFRRAWFSELPAVLDDDGIPAVDGVLLDLGIASPQIDDPAARLLAPRATDRSTCAWIHRADKARRNGSLTFRNVNSGR